MSHYIEILRKATDSVSDRKPRNLLNLQNMVTIMCFLDLFEIYSIIWAGSWDALEVVWFGADCLVTPSEY